MCRVLQVQLPLEIAGQRGIRILLRLRVHRGLNLPQVHCVRKAAPLHVGCLGGVDDVARRGQDLKLAEGQQQHLVLAFLTSVGGKILNRKPPAHQDHEDGARPGGGTAKVFAHHHLLALARRLEFVPHDAQPGPKVRCGVVTRGRRVHVLDAAPHLAAVHVALGQLLKGVQQEAHERQACAQPVGDPAAPAGLTLVAVAHLPVDDLEHLRVSESIHVDYDRPVELVPRGQVEAAILGRAVQARPPLFALPVHGRLQVFGVDLVGEHGRERAQGVVQRAGELGRVDRALQLPPPYVVDAEPAVRLALVHRGGRRDCHAAGRVSVWSSPPALPAFERKNNFSKNNFSEKSVRRTFPPPKTLRV